MIQESDCGVGVEGKVSVGIYSAFLSGVSSHFPFCFLSFFYLKWGLMYSGLLRATINSCSSCFSEIRPITLSSCGSRGAFVSRICTDLLRVGLRSRIEPAHVVAHASDSSAHDVEAGKLWPVPASSQSETLSQKTKKEVGAGETLGREELGRG